MSSSSDPSRLVAGLARDEVSLELKTVDLCFIAILYLRAEHERAPSFEEDRLIAMFEETCDIVEPGVENLRKRATHAIQRLRDQRMLARVDGAGIVRSGEYTLTRLAAAVIEYYLDDEALTRESLTLLTRTLLAHLAQVRSGAKLATSDDEWREKVVDPLRIVVGDLVSGIERRQRGLDLQQEQLQTEIARLLEKDWFGAVDQCQSLLDATTETLRELNEVLLRDSHQFTALLQEIHDMAEDACPEARDAAQRVQEHVDRIGHWGRSRQLAWSDYYQYIHRFLRDVVRLDPDRALSQRLRDQVGGWTDRPFFLYISDERAIRLLRPLEVRVDRPAVTRPRTDRERALSIVPPADVLADIDSMVQAALSDGAVDLVDVTARVLPQLPEARRYAAAGHVAESVGRALRVIAKRERPWARAGERLEIENWTIPPRGARHE